MTLKEHVNAKKKSFHDTFAIYQNLLAIFERYFSALSMILHVFTAIFKFCPIQRIMETHLLALRLVIDFTRATGRCWPRLDLTIQPISSTPSEGMKGKKEKERKHGGPSDAAPSVENSYLRRAG